ncbi:hypothetical protein CLOM_g13604 [Closterium sp. NIES-68]|nr:hypothetical protein CLOM_g23440 [Closterium sp. NIES-68]GJP54524.1 hypothetical protein CLOM_g13604 [Closterium sp. NIES-68]
MFVPRSARKRKVQPGFRVGAEGDEESEGIIGVHGTEWLPGGAGLSQGAGRSWWAPKSEQKRRRNIGSACQPGNLGAAR